MNRTRWIFVGIVAAALLIVVAALAYGTTTGGTGDTGLTVARPETVTVRLVTALAVEPWVRAAAEQFNAAHPQMRPHSAAVVASDERVDSGGFEGNLGKVRFEVIDVGS